MPRRDWTVPIYKSLLMEILCDAARDVWADEKTLDDFLQELIADTALDARMEYQVRTTNNSFVRMIFLLPSLTVYCAIGNG